MFDVAGKVAIITGGASGVGCACAKTLLRNGLKAATLIDIDATLGKKTLEDFSKEFGSDRVMFLNVDVRDKNKFKEAFKITVKKFDNVDILINSAGVLDDSKWEQEVDVNIKGTINGTLLALDHYISKYKSTDNGLIINISSVSALRSYPLVPIYAGTKTAVLAVSRSFGHAKHFARTNVGVVTVCLGGTYTPLVYEAHHRLISAEYFLHCIDHSLNENTLQSVELVARELLRIVKQAEPGSVWVIEDDKEAYEIEFGERIGTAKL